MSNNDKNEKGSPTLMVTTIVVLLGVSMLGALLFIMRARVGRGMIHERALRAQEWMRKVDELGIELQMPALHEVVVGGGGSTKADPLERDLLKLNKRTWNEFMVCNTVFDAQRNCKLNDDPVRGACWLPALVSDA